MSWCFLKFGLINKYMYIPFFHALSCIIIYIIGYYWKSEKNLVFEGATTALSRMAIIILPSILQFDINSNKENRKENEKVKKKYLLHYFILFLTFVINFLLSIFTYIYIQSPSLNIHQGDHCLTEVLQVIFISLSSCLILKTRYYRHHIISLIIFMISSVLIDLVVNNFNPLNSPFIIFFHVALLIITDSLMFVYQKYMMDKLYYSLIHIGFALGIYCLICIIGLFFYYYQEVITFFNEADKVLLFLKFITTFFLLFVINLFCLLTILHLTPNHIIISYLISKMFGLMVSNKSDIHHYSFTFFFFQFFSLLVYLEIIELNFCNLNKNTKRNIQLRGIEDAFLQVEDNPTRRSTEYSLMNAIDREGYSLENNDCYEPDKTGSIINTPKSINKGDEMWKYM